jgi:hypothetical protein
MGKRDAGRAKRSGVIKIKGKTSVRQKTPFLIKRGIR